MLFGESNSLSYSGDEIFLLVFKFESKERWKLGHRGPHHWDCTAKAFTGWNGS